MLSLECDQKRNNQEDLTMRETRSVQLSIFDSVSKHEHGLMLDQLSMELDEHSQILDLLSVDLIDKTRKQTGSCGLSVESIFRCLLLKQILNISYERLSFHLSDSATYRTFARLAMNQYPSRAGLQSVIREIRPETLQQINELLCVQWHDRGHIDSTQVRIDSTVVDANIAAPSDSKLLDDSIRVLSRHLATCQRHTGLKLRITDQRRKSRRLAFAIFYAKRAEKQALYPGLISCAMIVLKQIDRTLTTLELQGEERIATTQWIQTAEHYRHLLCQVIHQTQQRVYENISVASNEKVVSIFEPHVDIIKKSARETQYGHKINLATDTSGIVTYLSILEGNPADKVLYQPVLKGHQELFGELPITTAADGGYASIENVTTARADGVRQAAFHKRAGLGYHDMGVKRKTLKKLRAFRAGIEGNISELKRAFGLSKATWKKHDGFKAFVWSSVLAYNLVRITRLSTA